MPPGDPSKVRGAPPLQLKLATGEGPPETKPSSQPEPLRSDLPLPPRVVDSSKLHQLITGRSQPLDPSSEPFLYLQQLIKNIGSPDQHGKFSFSLEAYPQNFQLSQKSSTDPIVVTRSQTNSIDPFSITYFPDNTYQSSIKNTPHKSLTGLEVSNHSILTTLLENHYQGLIRSQNIYTRIRTSLESLQGRYSLERQSVDYENFAVQGGRAYSFRILNVLGIPEVHQNPQLNQISIFETSPTDRINLFSLSETGEINFHPEQNLRKPLSHEQLSLMEGITSDLEVGRRNPSTYQNLLRQKFSQLGNPDSLLIPEIKPAVEVPKGFSSGNNPWGLQLELRHGWELLNHLLPFKKLSWENPNQPGEIKDLKIPLKLKRVLFKELTHWASQKIHYGLSGNLRNPPTSNNWLKLQLFTEGGGQATLYRNAQLHDIIVQENPRSIWSASREIRQMKREGLEFSSSLKAIEAAVVRHSSNTQSGIFLKVQEAPVIDLDKLIDGVRANEVHGGQSKLKLDNIETAWKLIKQQIPAEIDYQLRYVNQFNKKDFIPNKPDTLYVDFSASQPSLQIRLQEQDIHSNGPTGRKLEVAVQRGEDFHARVYEDGLLRPDLSQEVIAKTLRQAQQGYVLRNPLTLAAQALPKSYLYYKTSGATFASAYFGALPLILGYEHFLYNSFEKKLLGTPTPRLSLSFFYQDFMVPFMTLTTASGITGILVDGIYNAKPGLEKTLQTYRSTAATLGQAYRVHAPSFFNESPLTRPVGNSLLFKGILQRGLPLFAGLTALEYLRHGKVFTPTFWKDLRNIGLVSMGSSAILQGVYASRPLAAAAIRLGLMEAVEKTPGVARYALRFRGGVAIALLEFAALGVLHAHAKKEMMAEIKISLQQRLGENLNLRNELIYRLSQGEDISLRQLIKTDFAVMEAQASYRYFLKQMNETKGTENFALIGNENDFEAEQQKYEKEKKALSEKPYSLDNSVALSRLQIDHFKKPIFIVDG